MDNESLTLHIVQDLATPHNNSLIRALRQRGDIHVVTWYAMRTFSALPWKDGLADDVDNYYYDNWLNRGRLIQRLLFHPHEKFVVIGYANWGTSLIFILSWLLRRKFMYWSDNPEDKPRSPGRMLLRRIAYRIIRDCAFPIFVVGRHTMETFKTLGFPAERLVNLPIFIALPPLPDKNSPGLQGVRQKYGVGAGEILLVGASRLAHQKGYDLLLGALARLDTAQLGRLKVLLVGHGPAEAALKTRVDQLELRNIVRFEQWLSPEDYERVIAAADVFVHPARFDAFGGGTLFAMALGIPVIGSDGAGAVVERIISGENGLVYPREDVQALANCIRRLMENTDEREKMGRKARATAEEWPPSRGAEIIVEALPGREKL